jgi:hypothetical protein
LSAHELAARKRALTRMQRVTIVTEEQLERMLTDKLVELGASGYTAIPCRGAGRRGLAQGDRRTNSQIRIETVVPTEIAESILDHLQTDMPPEHPIMTCTEAVHVLRPTDF